MNYTKNLSKHEGKMEILTNAVFENYRNRYNRILTTFYPSIGSTGLQERNLTVNFAEAYKDAFPNRDVLSWYELQFSKKEADQDDKNEQPGAADFIDEKKNNHLDCIIIDKTEKNLFVIESKRFTNTTGKSNAITKDIIRIKQFAKDIEKDKRFAKLDWLENFSIYGVILADVWTENKKKQEVLDSFKNEKYFSDKTDLTCDEYIYNTIVFDKDNIDCGSDYALLTFVWKIR